MAKTRIAINGAAGRMGRRLVALGSADEELEVAAALEMANHPDVGKDAGRLAGIGEIGVPLSAQLDVPVDAAIDFSLPAGTAAIIESCLRRGVPLIVATTGLDQDQQQQVVAAAEKIAIIWAPNMSLAVNLTMKLAALAAEALKDYPTGADVEIIERHHRFKKDAPSGTALRFGEIVAEIMGQTEHVHGRHGLVGQRPAKQIAYHALRVGDSPGEHTVVFGMLGETIELSVRATDRDCYAQGALAAAKFLAGRGPGLYSMNDVLGI